MAIAEGIYRLGDAPQFVKRQVGGRRDPLGGRSRNVVGRQQVKSSMMPTSVLCVAPSR